MELKDRIRATRKALGKNQREMSDLCEVAYSTWQAYETGRMEPKYGFFEKLYRHGVNPMWLIGEQQPILLNGLPQEYREPFNPHVMKSVIIGSLISFERNDVTVSFVDIANHIVDLYSVLLETIPREEWPDKDLSDTFVDSIRSKPRPGVQPE